MTSPADTPRASWQVRVSEWLFEAFGFGTVDCRPLERAHRFLEEALELAQACGCTRKQATELVGYVFGRPPGAVPQEVGGVMVTLGALCWTERVSLEQCSEDELARCWRNTDAIRAKAATKPAGSALPGRAGAPPAAVDPDPVLVKRLQAAVEGEVGLALSEQQARLILRHVGIGTPPDAIPFRTIPQDMRDVLSVQIDGLLDLELLAESLNEPWPLVTGMLHRGELPPMIVARKRAPDGYAYRYAAGSNNSTIRFGTGGGEVNGLRPIESVPYWLGDSGDIAGAVPIDMVLFCPACGHQHIDAPEPGRLSGCAVRHREPWMNPPHRSHRCHACGFEWRPADVATNGVAALKTRGQRDGSLGAMDASMAALNRIPAIAETLLLEILSHVRPPSARNGSWRVERGHCTQFDRAMTNAHMARGELLEATKARPLPQAAASRDEP